MKTLDGAVGETRSASDIAGTDEFWVRVVLPRLDDIIQPDGASEHLAGMGPLSSCTNKLVEREAKSSV